MQIIIIGTFLRISLMSKMRTPELAILPYHLTMTIRTIIFPADIILNVRDTD